jgi:polar amino acid transport system permease protein
VIFGGLLALARLSSSWLLSSLAWGYIWLFRSLPLIVVLIILYNFSYLYDTLSLGIPFTGVTWASYQTINVLGQFSTAVVGLTWCRAPIPEIIRGGFLGVDHGQYEAAAALGCPPGGARCALFCRRRCAPSCRPASTRSSASPRERRWCTSWRCRSCSTPSR